MFLSIGFADSLFDVMMKHQSKLIEIYSQVNQNYIDIYTKNIDANIRMYKRILGKMWGSDDVVLSGKKNYTFYSSDLKSRANIDLEKGYVDVEIISKKQPKPQHFTKKLKEIKKLTLNKGIKKELIYKNTDIKIDKKYNDINQEIIDQTIVKKREIKTKKLSSGKIVYFVKKRLKKDYIIILASKYIQDILKYSKQYKINSKYILAIIQTESSFNPKSIVPRVPAVGLMQLVPQTGARDAYRFVYKKDMTPSINYLLKPKNNIRLGIAYIYIIQNKYLKGIKDRKKLYLSTSTAYNAGIANLYRVVANSSRKRDMAVQRINHISYSKLYNILHDKNKLTTEATRYIEKVNKYLKYWYKNFRKIIF